MAVILFKVIQGQLSYEESFAMVRNENKETSIHVSPLDWQANEP